MASPAFRHLTFYLLGFVTFALTLATPARAQDWVMIQESARFEVFVDRASIRREGNFSRAWTRYDYHVRTFNSGTGKFYKVVLQSDAYDCARKQSAVTSVQEKDVDESLSLATTIQREDWRFTENAPGSIGLSTLNFVCSNTEQGSGARPAASVNRILSRNPLAPWRKVGVSDWEKTPADVFFDPDSILTFQSGEKSILLKFDFEKLIRWPEGQVSYLVMEVYLNCQGRSWSLSALTAFDINDRRITDRDIPGNEMTFKTITQNTPADWAHASACDQSARTPPIAQAPTSRATATPAMGTGWLSDTGYVVTAYHVIEGAKRISLLTSGKARIPASIVSKDQANDIAILRPQFSGTSPGGLSLANTAPNLGARTFTLGYPHPDLLGVSPKVTAGEVSATAGLRDDPRLLQISVPVQSGNSGGPLLNMNGEVVAIVSAKLSATQVLATTGDLTQNVNFAVKARYLQFLLDDLPRLNTPRLGPIPGKSLEELVARIRSSVFIVIAE